jgi:acetyltransferase-like isoleucine patch superfamily enzyme
MENQRDSKQPLAADSEVASSVSWAYRKDEYLLALLGVIPTGLGRKIRQIVYASIFKRFGEKVGIEANVRFNRPKSIDIGSFSSICDYSLLNCWEAGSELILENSVRLDQGFHLQALGGTIRIGAGCYIGPYVCMAGPGDITVGKNCLIASHSGLYANNHIFSRLDVPINQQGLTTKGITIGDDCWLGSGVKIMDGVTVGQGSVIGAGSVVTKNIPPYSVAVGVPAKIIRQRSSEELKQAARELSKSV